jgi:hypothetical protein
MLAATGLASDPVLPTRSNSSGDSSVTVACYHPSNYHPNDPRNEKAKGPGWCEWELVKTAKPSFPGHHQPNVPLWGYTDESDPEAMAQKIDASADHGIDAFIFDWYCYNDGPFLDRPIDEGYLKAANHSRLKLAFMWANHDWGGHPSLQAASAAETSIPRSGDDGDLRENRSACDQELLPKPSRAANRIR